MMFEIKLGVKINSQESDSRSKACIDTEHWGKIYFFGTILVCIIKIDDNVGGWLAGWLKPINIIFTGCRASLSILKYSIIF